MHRSMRLCTCADGDFRRHLSLAGTKYQCVSFDVNVFFQKTNKPSLWFWVREIDVPKVQLVNKTDLNK